MPIPALMGWIGGLSAGAKLSMASSLVSGLSSYAAAKAQRKQAIADQDNQYVRMRNAAQRAGFNPLTVLRATGGQGFTGLPVISKAAAFGNASAGIFEAVRQSPIDKYNKEIRELEKKQRKADLKLMPMRGKLMRAQIKSMNDQQIQNRAIEVPVMDLDGQQMKDAEGQPLFMHALNQEVQPLYITVRDQSTGEVFGYPNPELADIGPAEFGTFMTLTGLFQAHQRDGTGFQYKGFGLPAMPRFDRGVKFKDNRNIGSLSMGTPFFG